MTKSTSSRHRKNPGHMLCPSPGGTISVIAPPSSLYRSFTRPLFASSGTTLSTSPWMANSGTFAFASPASRSTGLNSFNLFSSSSAFSS